MKHKHKKVGLLALASQLFLSILHIFLELPHGVFQRRPGVIYLINNKDILANQVVHLQGAQIQPLCAGDLGAGDFFRVSAAQVFVQRETDGLDGNVGLAGAFQK